MRCECVRPNENGAPLIRGRTRRQGTHAFRLTNYIFTVKTHTFFQRRARHYYCHICTRSARTGNGRGKKNHACRCTKPASRPRGSEPAPPPLPCPILFSIALYCIALYCSCMMRICISSCWLLGPIVSDDDGATTKGDAHSAATSRCRRASVIKCIKFWKFGVVVASGRRSPP